MRSCCNLIMAVFLSASLLVITIDQQAALVNHFRIDSQVSVGRYLGISKGIFLDTAMVS